MDKATDLFFDTHLSNDRHRSMQFAVSSVNNNSVSSTGNFPPRVSLVKSGPSPFDLESVSCCSCPTHKPIFIILRLSVTGLQVLNI